VLTTPRLQGVGLGLRAPHFHEILETRPRIPWFEAITENHLHGRPAAVLERVREHYPVVLHGVSLSIGSTDPINEEYLARVKALAERVRPAWISDHVCWTGVAGENLHDLLPLPYTEEALQHLVPRILHVQERLGRRLVLENVSAYLSFRHSHMSEWEFLSELCRRADCELLLDLNNIYVSAANQGFEPLDFLAGVPRKRVRQFHLAGHSRQGDILIDTHDQPVADPVWALYAAALRHFGDVPTLLERDDRIPPLHELQAELSRAERLREESHVQRDTALSP
jgi:uncharacterized protein (UPF0276 family)